MITRRGFLSSGAAAGGGLLLGFELLGCRGQRGGDQPSGAGAGGGRTAAASPGAVARSAQLNAWIRIDSDDTVTFLVHESEMGQGVLTSFALLLNEELRADWARVRAEHAPADEAVYGDQVTGGSSSLRSNYQRLRVAGAAAREMLLAAAAARFGAQPGECTADAGVVTCARLGKRARYGELAAEAAALTPPDEPPLTPPERMKLVGKGARRLDSPDKLAGRATFGLDVRVPGMRFAQVARCPIFGGALKRFSADKALAVPGVRKVIELPSGVAVVADNTWAAMKGREALEVEWDDRGNGALSTASIRKACQKVVSAGAVARNDGDAVKALGKAPRARTLSAVYEVPYLAHAPLEPLGATARIADGRCEVWAATQAPGPSREAAATASGLRLDQVTVHTTMLGGGFGRRAQTDFVAEAVQLAARLGEPVQVVWSREDDIRGGYYRPAAYNELSAVVGADGLPVAWLHKIASPSILSQFGPLVGGIDRSAVEGARTLPYAIPSVRVTYAVPEVPVTVWFWRSVGSSANAYVTECFLDELARLGKRDPLELRRALLKDKPEHLAVLDLAADMAGWGTPPAAGRARGIAVHEAFGSVVAQVAEISIDKNKLRVHDVHCAIHCGPTINPHAVEAQMESSVAFGLSAALYGEVTFEGGRAVQGNFDDYRVVRMRDMPRVHTGVVRAAADAKLGGVGEPGVPPIAPAVANAVLALTGKPVRSLPIRIG